EAGAEVRAQGSRHAGPPLGSRLAGLRTASCGAPSVLAISTRGIPMRFRRSLRLAALALAGLVAGSLPAAAHDIPDRISMHAFAKPEGTRLHLLVRVPLTLLLNINLPKRGPGYLDLAHVDGPLATAAEAVARDFEVRADGVRLEHVRVVGRISPSSDRAFESYDR